MLVPEARVAQVFPDATEVTWRDQGANGDVYRVRRPEGDRAVKVVDPDVPADRLARELDALQAIDSPYVVCYRSHGTITHEGRNYPFIEMDWVDGRSLQAALVEVRAWPLARRIELLARICDGLGAMGAVGVVHRDLKPGNVMLTSEDTPKIVDLGWARDVEAATITEAWRDTGTLPFNSPEQLRHERVGIRSDLFSLGVIAFMVIIGEYPFQPRDASESVADLLLAGRATVSLLADVEMTDDLAEVIERLIAPAPAQRPRNGAIAADELRRALGAGRPPLSLFPRPAFLPILGYRKSHLRAGFFDTVAAHGVVAPLNLNVANHIDHDLQVATGDYVLVDPCSPLSATVRTEAPRGFRSHQLPESFTPADVGDGTKLDAFIDRYFDVERDAGATVLISPYFDCSAADLTELDATLRIAETAAARADDLPMLAGVSLHRAQLANATLRPALLDLLTSVDVESFYVLINDGRADYRQLDDRDLLLGLKDLTLTLRQNRQGVFFARMGSAALCLVTAGASGFSCGCEARNLHYAPDVPAPAGGAVPVPRYYETEILSFLRYTESRAARGRIDPKTKAPPLFNCACPFCTGADLMGAGEWDEDAARRHLLLSFTDDVRGLGLLKEADRRAWLDDRLRAAIVAREALTRTGPALSGDSATPAYQVWRQVFLGPAAAL